MTDFDYKSKPKELHEIIRFWLKDYPELADYEVRPIRRTWISCGCERIDFFCIELDGITHFDAHWTIIETIPAADPNFFDKLYKLLVKACKVAQQHLVVNNMPIPQ